MYLGRYMQGQNVPLAIRTHNAAGTPSQPDNVPTARIYKGDGTLIASARLPVVDPKGTTGLFVIFVFLGPLYVVGNYRVVYEWAISGTQYVENDYFEIGAGGNKDGSVISIAYYPRPNATFLITQLDSGKLQKRQNPRL